MGLLNADLVDHSPYLAWPVLAIFLIIVPAAVYPIYNVFLHPLRTVPGPQLWAASPIPYTVAWLSGRLHFVVHDLHEKYGDVVRITPNRVSFTHPDAWREIRGHRKNGQGEHGKDPVFYSTGKHHIVGASRDDHARFRRILSHAFSAKSMQEQQPLITGYVDLLMQRLGERTTDASGTPKEAVVDLAAWFNFTTFDVIGDLAFGESFGCLEESKFHPWVDIILTGVKQFGYFLAITWYFPDMLRWMKALSPKRYFGASLVLLDTLTHQKLKKRLALDISRSDFVEVMATAKTDNGQTLTMEEMTANARLLVVAGSETTATTLTGAAYFLATHPNAQKKLADEVRSAFATESEIDLLSVNRLSYMLAVLDEAMRVYPPVPSQLPRVCQKGGDVICGYHVPGGTGLEIWPWAMNHSSRNFTEPDSFIPERWLPEDEYEGVRFDKRRQGALQPFSVGPRNCIGKNLAYVEMRLILARLVFNYDIALADDTAASVLDGKAFALWVKDPLHIRLTPVLRKQA